MSENNKKPALGIVCVSQNGERIDLAEQFYHTAVEELKDTGLEVITGPYPYTVSARQVLESTQCCQNGGADVIVYLVGTWILTNHIIDSVMETTLPVGILGIPEPVSFSSVGANAVHGTLEELSIDHELFYGYPDDQEVLQNIKNFATAGQIKRRLKRARLGLIGGRAISAYPTSSDPNQVKEKFGVEVEHIDQLVLLEKARKTEPAKIEAVIRHIQDTYRSVEPDKDILQRSAAVYLALKEMFKEYDLTMCSVKCLEEFINHYVSCCLPVSMLNDEGYLMGCQCNINAMLSSFILNMLSDEPAYFGDINTVDIKNSTARVINCGSTPGRLAASYQDIDIVSQYDYMGKGGGACTLFCCKPGDVTFGTLGRIHGEYVMSIAQGTAYTEPQKELRRVRTWAQGFIRLDCDMEAFYYNIRSNHSTFCYGHVGDTLKEVCRVLGVRVLDN